MKLGISLLDKAAKVCGSDAELARRLGITRQDIHHLRNGRTISPATAAELADIAGEDAREAAIAAIIESAAGKRREGRLREVLGKGVAAGVAGMLVISYSEGSNYAIQTATRISEALTNLYIVLSRMRPVSLRLHGPAAHTPPRFAGPLAYQENAGARMSLLAQ